MSTDRVSLRVKTAFGVGAVAEGATLIGFNSFNMLFYNQVLKVPGALVGLAATVAILLDAIVDPAIGSISDRWRSRLGRRHPFLFAAPLPAAVSFYFIYRPPSGLSEFGLFLWLTVWTVLLRQALALFTIPHLALGAELSPSYTERSAVMSWNAIFGWFGGAAAGYCGWQYFFAVRDGVDQRFDPSAYGRFGVAIAVVCAIVIFSSALFTLDQLPKLPKPSPSGGRAGVRSLAHDIAETLHNKNYRALLLGLVFLSAALGIFETLGAILGTYFWGLASQDLAKYSFASAIGYWVAFFLTARLHKRFDKRPMIIFAIAGNALAGTMPIWLRFAGLMPPNGSPKLLPVLLAFFTIGSGMMAILMISVMSALADVADEHELESGRRQEGIFYASRIFFSKAINGLGHLLGGLVLDLVSFPKGAVSGGVQADVLHRLGMSTGVLMLVPSTIAIFYYARYGIDKRVHALIREKLAARRSNAPAAPAAAATRGSDAAA